MGQHATIHGKNSTPEHGASGTWIPVSVNDSGQPIIAPLQGELTQFNRLAGGPIVQYAVVSSDATGLDIATGPAVFYGMYCLTVDATGATVYDSTTATGQTIQILASGAVNTFYGPGQGIGILCNNGITVNWGAGSYLVFYVPAV